MPSRRDFGIVLATLLAGCTTGSPVGTTTTRTQKDAETSSSKETAIQTESSTKTPEKVRASHISEITASVGPENPLSFGAEIVQQSTDSDSPAKIQTTISNPTNQSVKVSGNRDEPLGWESETGTPTMLLIPERATPIQSDSGCWTYSDINWPGPDGGSGVAEQTIISPEEEFVTTYELWSTADDRRGERTPKQSSFDCLTVGQYSFTEYLRVKDYKTSLAVVLE